MARGIGTMLAVLLVLTANCRSATRPLTESETEILIPSIVATRDQGIEPYRPAAHRLLDLLRRGGGSRASWGTGNPASEVAIGGERVRLQEGFAPMVAGLGHGLRRLRNGKTLPAAGKALEPLFRSAVAKIRADRVLISDQLYLISRVALLVAKGEERHLAFVPEPASAAIGRMLAARKDLSAVLREYRGHPRLWKPADPTSLVAGLERRAERLAYDEERLCRHLELVLGAIIPNLVDSVSLDLAACLRVSGELDRGERVLAAVAIRQDNKLNRLPSREDVEFMADVAPLNVLLIGPSGFRVCRWDRNGTGFSPSDETLQAADESPPEERSQ